MSAQAEIDIRVNTEGAQQSLDKFQGAIDTLGGSVEVVFGSLALFGVENEWIKNLEQGAVGAIALADGTKRMTEGIIRFTGATTLAEAAQKAFNLVVNANPYVLAATAILGIATALFALAKNSKDAAAEAERMRKEYVLQQAALDRTGSALIKVIENEKQLANLRKSVTIQTQQQLLRNQERLNEALLTERRRVEIAQKNYETVRDQNKKGLVGLKNVEDALANFENAQKTAGEQTKFLSEQLSIVNGEIDARANKTNNSTTSTNTNTAAIEKQNEALRAQQELLANQNKYLDSIAALEEELYEAGLSQRDKERKDLEDQYYERLNVLDLNRLAVLESAQQLTDEETAELAELNRLKLLIEEQYLTDKKLLQDKFDEQDKAASDAKKAKDDEIAAGQLAAQQELNNRLLESQKELAADEENLQQAKRDALSATFDLASSLAGDNEKVQKAIFLGTKLAEAAQVAVDTTSAVTGIKQSTAKSVADLSAELAVATGRATAGDPVAIAAVPVLTGLIATTKTAGAAKAAAARIRGATAVASILASSITGLRGGGGGGGDEGGGGGSSGISTGAFATLSLPGQNQNQPPQSQPSQPIQAYVLAGDVSSGLEAQQKIQERRRL